MVHNILIADDHTIVREGLKQIVSETCDIKVTDEASNGQEVLDKITNQHFDVIVLVAVLLLISWFIFKKRLRRGILWTSLFSLIYF